MNLLTINPISSCNLSCEHCPNKKWTYPIDDERNRLNNEIIFQWLNKYFDPYECFLEISGGEPGLYPEIYELIQELNSMGYYGIIRTNGTLPLPCTNNFKRFAAWHKMTDLAHPPAFRDVMLILMNPDDCWEDKIQYCLDNHITYKCLPYIRFGDPEIQNEPEPPKGKVKVNTFFKHWTIVGSSGIQAYCYANWGEDKDNIFNLAPPLLRDMMTSCHSCVGVIGVLNLLDDEFKQMLAVRRDKKRLMMVSTT